MDNEGII